MTNRDIRAQEAIGKAWEESGIKKNHWKALAAWLEQKNGYPVNRGLLCAVARGQKRSKAVNRALGLTRKQIRLCATLTAEERKEVDELINDVGHSWTTITKALIWYSFYMEDGLLLKVVNDYKRLSSYMVHDQSDESQESGHQDSGHNT